MLANFFIGIIILLVSLFVILIIRIGLPMWRFLTKSNDLINLYDLVSKILLETKFSCEEGTIIVIKYNKYELQFSSSKQASEKLEELINDALDDYNKLGPSAENDNDLKIKRDILINILAEIRTTRWKNEDF